MAAYIITSHPNLAQYSSAVSKGFRASSNAEAKRKADRLHSRTGKNYWVFGPDGREVYDTKSQRKINPVSIPTRLTPARIKVGRKIVNGHVKRVNGQVKVFVTPGTLAKNPSLKRRVKTNGRAQKIVPITKERYSKYIKPLLRAPYSLMPFALYKRTIGKGLSMLFRDGQFIKAGTKQQLTRYARLY